MPAHLRPPERPVAHRLGALALAVGVALIVFASFSGPQGEEVTTRLVQPASDATTDPTVLGAVIERTTLPDAPAASAAGFTTTSTSAPAVTAPPPTSPAPTLGPPVSITAPPTTRPPTTTTSTSTTTTTEPTTTTETTDTTVP